MNKKKFLLVFIFFLFLLSGCSKTNSEFLNEMYVSYGNIEKNCEVESTKLDENQIIEQYGNYDYLKIDKITSVKGINFMKFQKLVSKISDNQFNYGLVLNDEIVLLSEEVNANKIIDYDRDSIDIDNLKDYLKDKNANYEINKIKNISLFETESKLYYENSFIDLHLANGFHIRSLDVNKKELASIIKNASNLLMSMNGEDGEFIYGRRANTGKEINDYNILRHSGSTWSLILEYQENPSEELKNVIKRSIDYVLNNYMLEFNSDISFVVEKKSQEIKLGGNALTLLTLSDYYLTFNDSTYNDIARKIANGIIYMQNENGSYKHVLYTNFELKNRFRTVYYDGEATFALLKFFEASNEQKYFDCAKKAIDMFVNNHYEQYRDQWISYAMLDFISYNMDEKYIQFILNNYLYNISAFDDLQIFSPTRLELLINVFKSYNYIVANKSDSPSIKAFNLEKLKKSIDINMDVLFRFYANEEVAMYFAKPYLSFSGFFSHPNNFRMRIDDIQHSMSALIFYNRLFN